MRTKYGRGQTIHGVFENQARQTPDAVAVADANTHLTYSALNGRANAVARRLAALGVTLEMPVGICMERSPELLVGLLAILKSGGAYVPLNASYPRERLAFMIEDTQITVLVTQRGLVEKLPATNASMIFLDEGETAQSPQDIECATPREADGGLAYILYTSGSTGAPKGVAVTHRGVIRLVKQTNYADLSPDETFLQLSPISFDASTFEIWGALLNGGKLALMPPGQPSLDEIGNTIRRHGVTTALFTTGPFNLMVEERLDDLRPLRQVLVGGEALSVPHVRKAVRELKTTRVINGYGPTESTTFACCHTVGADEPLDRSVPIGRPIANTTAHILDEKLQPLPIGTPGELFIGGDGLARGYWRRAELTAEKFIADPFSDEPHARLYRTGDLARWRGDGVIEYLGRLDQQVKIRGFRIELGEIETVLASHDAIRSAVVVARDGTHAKELVAYFISENDAALSPAAIREWLLQKLPDHMIPAAFVPLRAFPLTAHGKIDRRALPAPPRARSQTIVAPKTALEISLAEIWRAVLGFDEIGTADNFFDVGGDSMRLIEVHSKLIRALRRPLSLNTLLQYPTISALADFLNTPAKVRSGVADTKERGQKQRAALARNLFKQPKE